MRSMMEGLASGLRGQECPSTTQLRCAVPLPRKTGAGLRTAGLGLPAALPEGTDEAQARPLRAGP